jgi:hypothetical protein
VNNRAIKINPNKQFFDEKKSAFEKLKTDKERVEYIAKQLGFLK